MKKTLLLALICITFSCQKKEEQVTPAPVYTPQWQSIKQSELDSCYYKDGGIYIANKHHDDGNGSIGTGLSSLFDIKGDCEFKIAFSEFKTTGTGSLSDLFEVRVYDKVKSKLLLRFGLSNNYMGILDTLNNTLRKPTTAREGELYLKREGNKYTTWLRAGSDTSFYNSEDYPNPNLLLTIAVTTTEESNPVKRASVQVGEMWVKDAQGNVISEPWNENSIEYQQEN